MGVLEGLVRALGSHEMVSWELCSVLEWYRHPSVSTIENIFECKNDIGRRKRVCI